MNNNDLTPEAIRNIPAPATPEDWDDRIWNESMKRITAGVVLVAVGFGVGVLLGQGFAENSNPHRVEITVDDGQLDA